MHHWTHGRTAEADRLLGPCNDPDCPTGSDPDPEWITYKKAAEMLGVTHTTVGAMIKDGRLVGRKLAASSYPSVNAASVRAHAAEREAAARVREQARHEHQQRQLPPQDGDVWLSARVAAAVLGITPARMYQRAHAGRTPFTWKDGRMWFRRSDIEMRGAVVAFHEIARGRREDLTDKFLVQERLAVDEHVQVLVNHVRSVDRVVPRPAVHPVRLPVIEQLDPVVPAVEPHPVGAGPRGGHVLLGAPDQHVRPQVAIHATSPGSVPPRPLTSTSAPLPPLRAVQPWLTPWSAVETVVAVSAAQLVGSRSAVDAVVARAADPDVFPLNLVREEAVAPRSQVDDIVARIPKDVVSAPSPVDDVGTPATSDGLTFDTALQHVRAVGAGDEPREDGKPWLRHR